MIPYYAYGRHKRRYYYYQCSRRQHLGKGNDEQGSCNMIYVPAHEIENLIFNEIKKLSINKHFLEEVVRETNQTSVIKVEALKQHRKKLEEQKREAEKRRDNYSRMIGDGVFYNLGEEEKTVMLDGMKKAIKEIENAIMQVDFQVADEDSRAYNVEIMHKTIMKFSELFEIANEQEKKDLVKLVVHKIIFTPNEVRYSLYESPERTKLLDTGIGEEFRCNVASIATQYNVASFCRHAI